MVNLAFKAPEPAAKLTAEEQYQDLTEQVVNLTSYHVLSEESGELVQRQTRESNFRAAIRLINERLDLGLDRTESEMLTLVYTALSEAPRFLGNDHLEARKGGNTGQHSIHTPLRAKLLVDRALEQLESDDTPEAIKLRKVTGLALMLHDFGESLGEPGTLEQESKNASFQKDKPAAERLIMEGILYHAAAAVESGNYTKFYNRLDEMKIPDTSGKAQVESNEEFLAHVKERLGELPAISAESEARVICSASSGICRKKQATCRKVWKVRSTASSFAICVACPNICRAKAISWRCYSVTTARKTRRAPHRGAACAANIS